MVARRSALIAALLILAVPRSAPAAPPEISATFSIVAVDRENNLCGAAVASKYPAVGRVVPFVRAGVGAFCTQHYHVPEWGEQALDLLEDGKTPDEVLAALLSEDKRPGMRQLAIIDIRGRAAVHNPVDAPEWSRYWGAMTGRDYACQGNTLAGREVIVAMSEAFEETKGSLADRLMAALVAADCAGGDHRGRLAAGIRVAKIGVEGDWLSLHVDESDEAVIDLARKYAELDHPAKGDWSGGKLPFVHPCEGQTDRPLMTVKATEDFEVTGDGGAPAWESTEWVSLNRRPGGKHDYDARVKMLYSKSGLYVLMDGTDRKLTATMTEDFQNLWTEDVFEVFLWPDERHPVYFEYEISPLGYELPILIPNLDGKFFGWTPWHYAGDRKTRKAVAITGGAQESGAAIEGWSAEMFFPYDLLKPLHKVPPQPGTRWRANFYRVDYDGGESTAWDWSRVGPSFHEYQKFGTLIFE